MCIVCGPGGNRFLQAISTRYGGSKRRRFAAEEVLPETTPPLNPLDRADLEGPADVILRGGPIVTMRRSGEVVMAMALRAGRIQRLGDENDVLPLRGRLTRLVDLEGGAVTPGFINAHWHVPLTLLCDWIDWIDPEFGGGHPRGGADPAWGMARRPMRAERHRHARDRKGGARTNWTTGRAGRRHVRRRLGECGGT